MLYLSLCVTEEQCNEKGAFEVCETRFQFPFKRLYLEQGFHTTWIPSMIKEEKIEGCYHQNTDKQYTIHAE